MPWSSEPLPLAAAKNEPALKASYHQGLNPAILSKIACRNKQKSLECLSTFPFISTTCCRITGSIETMQAELTLLKQERRRRAGLCLYFGSNQH